MSSPSLPTNSASVAGGKQPSSAPRARILLVDDDPVNQMVALGLLRRQGWEAVAADNGKEALQMLSNQTFNLILMDLQMPEMDGFETTIAIRRREAQSSSAPTARPILDANRQRTELRGAHIPIIALTTASQAGVREKCLAAGMDDYLTKPINPRALYLTVERHLASPQ